MRTSNPYLHFRMDSTADGFYQTAVIGAAPDTTARSEPFEIVIGSGRKGQTYLHWEGDRLFQLPISHWVALGQWVTSPGLPEGIALFDRPVTPRCLECHTSYFEQRKGTDASNRYDTTNYTLGISCETCHGPGQRHVQRQRSSMARWLPSWAITNPADLPRERQIEACALCHGGVGELKAPAFSYVPGEPLVDHVHLRATDPAAAVDVHGNQVALLARSPCFQASDMTCSTCHDVHVPQRNAAAFSARCLGCHTVQSCGLFPERGHAIAENCVDCHMPNLPSNTIVSTHDGEVARPRVRTHWIRVYPELRVD